MKRRVFTKEFKISVLRELEAGKTTTQLSREHAVHPSTIRRWRIEYRQNPKTAFSGNGSINNGCVQQEMHRLGA